MCLVFHLVIHIVFMHFLIFSNVVDPMFGLYQLLDQLLLASQKDSFGLLWLNICGLI
jgi:hypothetical protein